MCNRPARRAILIGRHKHMCMAPGGTWTWTLQAARAQQPMSFGAVGSL
jgi:hypothetical protein